MKGRFFLILVLFSIPLCALDYGLTLDNSLLSDNSMDVENRLQTTLFLSGNPGFGGAAEMKVYFSHSTEDNPSFPWFLDIEILRYGFRWKGNDPDLPSVNINLGRFVFSDQTSYILSHTLDGIELGFHYPSVKVWYSMGYSGLLWNSSLNPSYVDTILAESEILGSPRLVLMTGTVLPSFGGQSVSLEALYQADLRKSDSVFENYRELTPEQVRGGGLLDTYYLSLKLRGTLAFLRNFSYGLSYIYNGGASMSVPEGENYYTYSDISAHLAEARIEKFFPDLFNSYISWIFLYSSGDEDFVRYREGNTQGAAGYFIPLTSSSSGIVFTPGPGNLIKNELVFSLKPHNNLQTALNIISFIRPSVGPLEEPGLDPSFERGYMGSEADITVNYRPFSDLGVSFTGGFYFPGAGVYSESYLEEKPVKMNFRLDLSFSL